VDVAIWPFRANKMDLRTMAIARIYDKQEMVKWLGAVNYIDSNVQMLAMNLSS
jgi:hypothetical protein